MSADPLATLRDILYKTWLLYSKYPLTFDEQDIELPPSDQ